MRSIVIQLFAVGLILASQALAAPLELKHVAADARWLAHVDVDAIRASTVVQKAWHKALAEHPEIEAKLNLARTLLGMDPTKDVNGITFYGKVIGKPEAVTIVTAAFDPQHIIALAAVMPGRETTKHGDYVIHSWAHQHHGHAIKVASTFRGKEQLVLAKSVDDLKAALDVLDSKAPGLTADANLGGNIPPGTTFLLRAEGIAEAKLPCKVPVVEQMQSFRLVVGESAGQSFVRARVTMTNPEAATLVLTAVQGWQAQCNLICPDELGRKFVNGAHAKAESQTVTILWSISANDVWDGVLKLEQEIKKHIARHHAHGQHAKAGHDGGNAPEWKGTPAKKMVPPEEDF